MPIDGLIALKSSPPLISVADAEHLARTLYGLSARATPLLGERDRNFRLTTDDDCDYVLKVIDPAADAGTVECQSLVLAHVAEQAPDLPVPRIIPTNDNAVLGHGAVGGEGYRVRLIEFMPGDLAVHTSPDPSLLGAIGRTLGRLDRALRGFFHPALAQPIVWDVRRAPALLAYVDYLASPASRRLVRQALEPLENQSSVFRALRAQAIHGDFHPCNVLINKARDACSGILDFGDIIHAPLVLDPAVTMAEFLIQGTARREHIGSILAGFCSLEPLEAGDIDVLYDLVTARIATALLVYAWRCHHDKGGAEATAESFALAEESLGELTGIGRGTLTHEWHRVAGTTRI